MKKFNYKSRKGFTLIELLVVIGILAVLAAIAIPSVAGLIDRANVSADDTNANEMTNALERFTSEYELFCQDIASGRFNKNDMDAAQSRVYNVTGAENRNDIKELETDTTDGLNGKKINRDTKYPENVATTKAIVENYTKTSSATYEPKQSDMNFYYSPDCGVVVFEEASASTEVTDATLIDKLNGKIISGKDAKGKELSATTTWLNLSLESNDDVNLNHGGNVGDLIPEGATYFDASANTTLIAGNPFPETLGDSDTYTYGLYKYRYSSQPDGWHVSALNKTANLVYSAPLSYINGKPMKNMSSLFSGYSVSYKLADDFYIPNTVENCTAMLINSQGLTELPTNFSIPDSVTTCTNMFNGCKNLKKLPANFALPKNANQMANMFFNCTSLENAPAYFNTNVTDTLFASGMFYNCTSLKEIPNTFKIPTTPTGIMADQMFANCSSLEKLPDNFTCTKNLNRINKMFYNCTNLTGTIIINCSFSFDSNGSALYEDIFSGTTKPITIKGSSPQLSKIAITAENGNVSMV